MTLLKGSVFKVPSMLSVVVPTQWNMNNSN